ncbi:MAG: HigA family addiction module antidote protein [Spirochaetaceae bacterium]|nr:HigA family addiction module antidote protein [Spirochaetaceae bacterium]
MAKLPASKTPSAVLNKYIEEFNLSISPLALELGQNVTTFKKILDGSKRISIELALLLAKKFGTTADFWIDLQKKAGLAEAKADAKFQSRLKALKKAVKVAKSSKSSVAAAPKKPGRKPGRKPAAAVAAPKKRGRKPGRKSAAQNASSAFSRDDEN